MVKVSIIVPVYNVDSYLHQCMDSIIDQTLDDYEIICVDDGSIDSSYKILKEYQEKYKFVHIFNNNRNRGLSYSRNYGIKEAKGEYLIFVDADDWLMGKDVLKTLYMRSKENNLELLRFRLNTDELDYCPQNISNGKKHFYNLIKHDSYKWESVRNFVKRDFLLKNEISFNEKVYGCEDILFSTQCIYYAERCEEIKEKFYFYNRREGSITRGKILSKNINGDLQVIHQLYNLFSLEHNVVIRYSILKLISIVSNMCRLALWELEEGLVFKDWDENVCRLYDILFRNGELIVSHEVFCKWDIILKSSCIYLYGAGMACHELWRNIKNRIDISGIIVTRRTDGLMFWNGIDVYEVTDSTLSKEALVIVSVTGNAQDEIKKELKRYSFNNVLFVGKKI